LREKGAFQQIKHPNKTPECPPQSLQVRPQLLLGRSGTPVPTPLTSAQTPQQHCAEQLRRSPSFDIHWLVGQTYRVPACRGWCRLGGGVMWWCLLHHHEGGVGCPYHCSCGCVGPPFQHTLHQCGVKWDCCHLGWVGRCTGSSW